MRPSLRVALVEGRFLAAGASGRNAGFLLQGAAPDYVTDRSRYGEERARRLLHFTRANRDLVASELDPVAFDLEASGSLTVAGSEEEDERLQEAVAPMRADGAPAAYLPPGEANRRIGGRGFFGALYVPSGAMLQPRRLVCHIAAASGVDVLEQHPVADVRPRTGGVVLETPQRAVVAEQVVLALNAYLPLVLPVTRRWIRPVRAQMFATAPASRRWLQVPAYTHEGCYYIRQARDGTVLLGGARHLHREDEVGYVDAITESLQADLEAYLADHFPTAQGLPVGHRWSGIMGFSPDGLPMIGTIPEAPGSFWAGGFTGHGMAYGFRFGRLLAEVVLATPSPEDLDLFHVRRFISQAKAPHPKGHVVEE